VTASNGRQLVRVDPPVDTVYWCRDCQSTAGVTDGATECIECDAVDEPGHPLVQSGEGPEMPIRVVGAGPRECVSCGTVWVTATAHVVWYFEGGLVGAVCPTCARNDAASSVWQQVVDVSDAIDGLMQAAAPTERSALAALISSHAQWFCGWRDNAAT
jgi:hypothetical protein